MQENWSVILNVLLLAGVFLAIVHIFRGRNTDASSRTQQPSIGSGRLYPPENKPDDVVSIRKIDLEEGVMAPQEYGYHPSIAASAYSTGREESFDTAHTEKPAESIMFFLQARSNQVLGGYDLLQTILAAGLRFGEGHLFHRHQHPNGKGPVLCSLAAATQTGVFDLQNIGAFSVRGLCLFMEASGNPAIDEERFVIMLETAKQLSEDLDTILLDEQQKQLTEQGLIQYCHRLDISSENLLPMIS